MKRLRPATAASTTFFQAVGVTFSIGMNVLFFIVPYLVLVAITAAHHDFVSVAPAVVARALGAAPAEEPKSSAVRVTTSMESSLCRPLWRDIEASWMRGKNRPTVLLPRR